MPAEELGLSPPGTAGMSDQTGIRELAMAKSPHLPSGVPDLEMPQDAPVGTSAGVALQEEFVVTARCRHARRTRSVGPVNK